MEALLLTIILRISYLPLSPLKVTVYSYPPVIVARETETVLPSIAIEGSRFSCLCKSDADTPHCKVAEIWKKVDKLEANYVQSNLC